jgi:LysR family glycine cleavage system transcriptional activator
VLCDDYKLARSNTRLFLHWLLGRFGRALTLPSGAEGDGNGQV